MAGAELAVRLLGPVELLRDGSIVPIGGPTPRALLSMLALRRGEPVPVDALAEGIWGESDEPLGGDKALRVYVARLRAALHVDDQAHPLLTVPSGYRLSDEVTVDVTAFESLLIAGRQQLAGGDARAALACLDEALALWRGPALMDVRDFPFAAHVALGYDEMRVDAQEDRFAACLALGEHRAIVADLRSLLAEHPYRERLHGQLMLALYRAGQQSAALQAYQSARGRLVLDLGVEPGPELTELQRRILAQDSSLATPQLVSAMSSPAYSMAPRPRSIPRTQQLFGREELLTELQQLARVERLLTLIGAGGTGKTAVALELLQRLAPGYPDGGAFVELAELTRPDQVLPAIAQSLGILPSGDHLRNRLAAVFAERRMVVVLDNCEHVLGAASDIAALVDTSCGLIVATSRAALRLRAERPVLIPPLPLPDDTPRSLHDEPTIQLFYRAATTAGAILDDDPAALAAIGRVCRAVDGLPLAIEIAAAATRVESVTQVEASIIPRLPALPALTRDVPSRQRTMDAAIGWSLESLSPMVQRAFKRLAVFAASFDATAAAAVLQTDVPTTRKLLSELLDASLLVRQPLTGRQARFRMLEPLRAVAKARANPTERAGTAARHAAFFVGEIHRLCPIETGIQQPDDLSQLRLEHPNLIEALWHLAAAEPDQAMDLVVQLDDYWTWTAGERHAIRLIDDLVAQDALSRRAQCEGLSTLANFVFRLGDFERAHSAINAALSVAHGVHGDATRARLRLNETHFAIVSGDRRRALRAVRAAIAHARAAGSRWLLAQALSSSVAARLMSRTPGGGARGVRSSLDEGLRLARGTPMPLSELGLLVNEQRTAGFCDTEPAGRALTIAQRFGAPELAAAHANNLGLAAIRRGSVQEGRTAVLWALRTLDRRDHRWNALYPLSSLGEVEAAIGHWSNALVLFSGAEAAAAEIGARGYLAVHDVEEAAAAAAAEEHLGVEAACEARAIGQSMTYRQAIDFALEINGVR